MPMVPAYLELLRRKMDGRDPASITDPNARLVLTEEAKATVEEAKKNQTKADVEAKEELVQKTQAPAIYTDPKVKSGFTKLFGDIGQFPAFQQLDKSIKEDRTYAAELSKMKPGLDLAPAIGLLAAQWGSVPESSLPDVYKVAKGINQVTPEKLAALKQAVLKNASDNELEKTKLQISLLNSAQGTGYENTLKKLTDSISSGTDPAPFLKAKTAAKGQSDTSIHRFLNRYDKLVKPNTDALEAATPILTLKSDTLTLAQARHYIVRSILGDTGNMNMSQENTAIDASLPGSLRAAWEKIKTGKLDAKSIAQLKVHAKKDYGDRIRQIESEATNIIPTAEKLGIRNSRQLLDDRIRRYRDNLARVPLTEREKAEKKAAEEAAAKRRLK